MKSLVITLFPLIVVGCHHSAGSDMGPPDMAPATTLGAAPALAVACTDQTMDVYTAPTGLPPMDDSHRGDVFHCAVGESLTAAKVNAQINAYNTAPPVTGILASNVEPGNVTSGFWTYRVAFRSERNTVNGTRAEGDMAAVLLVPEHPIAGAPLVVFAHGSMGVAHQCAPSLIDLTAPAADQDFPASVYRLAGYGYTVIAPDYAGYSYNQAPVGYFNAEDEAHAVLDATRAAANVLPSPPGQVVFVGHSLGGHAALAAQSYAKAYGMKGTLGGVAVFAPLWTSMALWAAAMTTAGGFHASNPDDQSTILYAMEYAYAAGALRGDPNGGLDIFQPAKQQAAKDVMYGGQCYDGAKLMALGDQPADWFDMNYLSNVGFNCAATPIGSDCTQKPSTPAGDAPLWLSRWQQDRPPLDPMSAPIVTFFGGMDHSARPGFAVCMQNKWAKDLSATGATTTIKVCYDANAQHRDIIRGADADWVNQWIAARAGIGMEPPASGCAAFPTGMMCETPPNDL